MSAVALMLFAWTIEVAISWPDWLHKRIGHPVVWFGTLVSTFEHALNRDGWSHSARYITGMISAFVLAFMVAAIAIGVSLVLPNTWWGIAIEALIASTLLASRSLHAHVTAVARPLAGGDLVGARQAVSMIVGRDPGQLDDSGIARASLESLAENASDGVIAPLFWGALFGLPGLAAYKAINTLDSMIGHKNDRYAAFGGFAARLDDVANLIPARLTGTLIATASGRIAALGTMLRDARHHRSPNAGWPEAAMAGGLGVRLSGPRAYGSHLNNEPWLNEGARDPVATDIAAGLAVYRRALAVAALALASIAAGASLYES